VRELYNARADAYKECARVAPFVPASLSKGDGADAACFSVTQPTPREAR
jgi:hypothetical protein